MQSLVQEMKGKTEAPALANITLVEFKATLVEANKTLDSSSKTLEELEGYLRERLEG